MVKTAGDQLEEGGSIPTSPLQLIFKSISYKEAMEYLVKYHYLHRKAPTSWSFGAFYKDNLVGACTIGKPASHTLLKGVAGENNQENVFELNRLHLQDSCPKFSESRFIGWVIRYLPKGIILVSYADTAYNHLGKVYQATNWIYTGQSMPWVDYTRDGLDHRSIPKHERKDKSRLTAVARSKKNRYVYFTDIEDIKYLKYPRLPYPKGDT